MPQTVTEYGRQKITWPDLGYDGGANLHSAITGSVARISNQISRYWSGVQTLTVNQTINLEHNFGLDLTQLRVRFFENGSELVDGSESGLLLNQVSTAIVSLKNTGATSRTVQVYIEPKMKVRVSDLDPGFVVSSGWESTGVFTLESAPDLFILNLSSKMTTIDTSALTIPGRLLPAGPIDGPVENGWVVRIFGFSNTNTLTLDADALSDYLLLNGDAVLSAGSMIELQFVSNLNKWVEVTRNMIAGA